MDILINRFTTRYNGADYGPGKIIRNVPDEQGQKMVDESNGEMQALPAAETAATTETAGQENTEGTETGAEQTGVSLDQVDPEKTVKGKK